MRKLIIVVIPILFLSPALGQVWFDTPEEVYEATFHYYLIHSTPVLSTMEQYPQVLGVYLHNPETETYVDAIALFSLENQDFLLQFWMFIEGEWIKVYDYKLRKTLYG